MVKINRMSFLAFCLYVITSISNAAETKTIYLSGTDTEDAVDWQFKMKEGFRGGGAWTTIPVPSCWQQHGFGNYHTGSDKEAIFTLAAQATYKHEFTVDPSHKDQRVLLFFDGVLTMTEVKVNGQLAGPVHHGGFFQFHFDITDKVKFGETNLLEVEVDEKSTNKWLTLAERRGDYWKFGGIYRPVYLEIVPKEYIEEVVINGTMDGLLELDIYGKNVPQGSSFSAQLLDIEKNPVGGPMKSSAKKGDKVTELSDTFDNVKLWSTEYPNLYYVKVDLIQDGQVIHSVTERFGFRTFELIPRKGFYLNGERIILNGVARHCFWPDTGRAVSREQSYMDVRLIREMNINFVRSVHYPPDTHFFEACDELGMLTSSEMTGWISQMPANPGRDLVKSMVLKDEHHPSLVFWNNGNHNGGSPKLSVEYHKWDTQKRPVVWNHSRQHPTAPGSEVLGEYAVDTRFYPTYNEMVERLNGDTYLVLPGETNHAMYDGGGGANLAEFMRLSRSTPLGAGIVIWAYSDGGLVRTDKGGILDTASNEDPDGIVGPYREKEASFATVREVFCPIQIHMEELDSSFNGTLPIRNDYLFTSLEQCKFEWQLLNVDSGEETIIDKGMIQGPAIQAGGNEGTLKLPLPSNWKSSHALHLKAYNHRQEVIMDWTWAIEQRADSLDRIFAPGSGSVSGEGFTVESGGVTFTFDSENGTLESVVKGGKTLPLAYGPHIYAARDQILERTDKRSKKEKKEMPDFINLNRDIRTKTGKVEMKIGKWSARAKAEGANYVVEGRSENRSAIKWIVKPGGVLELKYKYQVPKNSYNYIGVGFDLDDVKSKTWLGEGPYRVWKNRLEGPQYGLWSNKYNDGIPGEVWELPAFKGNFQGIRWMNFETGTGDFTVGLQDEGRFLGVLIPKNSIMAVHAMWSYPKTGGLFVFNHISPVGSKWRPAKSFGPKAQPLTRFDGPLSGSLLFKF